MAGKAHAGRACGLVCLPLSCECVDLSPATFGTHSVLGKYPNGVILLRADTQRAPCVPCHPTLRGGYCYYPISQVGKLTQGWSVRPGLTGQQVNEFAS